jgi:hypothetical protein
VRGWARGRDRLGRGGGCRTWGGAGARAVRREGRLERERAGRSVRRGARATGRDRSGAGLAALGLAR